MCFPRGRRRLLNISAPSSLLAGLILGLALASALISCSGGAKTAKLQVRKAEALEQQGADPVMILAYLREARKHKSNLNGLAEKIGYYENFLKGQNRFRAVRLPAPINSPAKEGFPVVTPDGNTLIFTSNRPGSLNDSEDFWMCRKRGQVWAEAVNLGPRINSPLNEGSASITPDGREIYFSKITPTGGMTLFHARLEGGTWSTPIPLSARINASESRNSASWNAHPSISVDGRTLFFCSLRNGGYGKRDIWMATRDSSGEWMNVENLGPAINTENDEIGPFIHYDGTTLYFSSDRPGGCGGYDVYRSRNEGGIWQAPKNLGPSINSSADETQYMIRLQGDSAYFSRSGFMTEVSASSNSDIFQVAVPDSMRPRWTAYVSGSIRDAKSEQPLEATVRLLDLKHGSTEYTTRSLSENGRYLIVLPIGKIYDLQVSSSDHVQFEELFDFREAQPLQRIDRDFALYPTKTRFLIKGIMWDAQNNHPLGGVRVMVEDMNGEVVAVVYSDYETGAFVAEIPSDRRYRVSASSGGFWPDWYEVPASVNPNLGVLQWDCRLKPIQLDSSFSTSIYFNTGEGTIRPESFAVLDRLCAEVLVKYPQYGFKIKGHTDSIGDERYNLNLSEKRARSVMDFWIAKGISPIRLVSIGYGESHPIDANDTDEGRKHNRRTELVPVPLMKLTPY
jgi:outer membrane protein OmpA-like peptidoglycan-associated protein